MTPISSSSRARYWSGSNGSPFFCFSSKRFSSPSRASLAISSFSLRPSGSGNDGGRGLPSLSSRLHCSATRSVLATASGQSENAAIISSGLLM
jgi:hypothetical protein